MKKGRLTRWMLAVTVAAVALMATERRGEETMQARMVRVTMGEIQSVVAISGRVGYQEETMVYAALPGYVEEILVKPGERVCQGQALARLGGQGYEAAVSAWLATDPEGGMLREAARLMEGTVIRSPKDANVRRILTMESAPVSSGTPVVLLSSARQEIVCAVQEADLDKLRVGQDAVLYADGIQVGTAEVTGIGELEADQGTGRLFASVTLAPQQQLPLPAGASIEAEVVIVSRGNVPTIPVEAVTERDSVWWLYDGERCTEIPVEIILSDEKLSWVNLPEGLCIAVGEFEEGQKLREELP